MYKEIRKRDNIYTMFKNKLVEEGILTEAEAEERWDAFMKHYNDQNRLADDEKLAYRDEFDFITPFWRGIDQKVPSPPK